MATMELYPNLQILVPVPGCVTYGLMNFRSQPFIFQCTVLPSVKTKIIYILYSNSKVFIMIQFSLDIVLYFLIRLES